MSISSRRTPCRDCAKRFASTPGSGRAERPADGWRAVKPGRSQAVIVLNTIRIRGLQGRTRRPGYTAGVPAFPVPPLPAVIDLSLVAVALGSLLILRLAHGALPWGHLMIAVGPDGRPMRPRVKWHLWSISHGESPRLAAIGGLASGALGCAAAAALGPRLFDSVVHPVNSVATTMMIFTIAMSTVLVPLGLSVLIRATLDLTARRSSMVGLVVGMRPDARVFGRSYRTAVQTGGTAM